MLDVFGGAAHKNPGKSNLPKKLIAYYASDWQRRSLSKELRIRFRWKVALKMGIPILRTPQGQNQTATASFPPKKVAINGGHLRRPMFCMRSRENGICTNVFKLPHSRKTVFSLTTRPDWHSWKPVKKQRVTLRFEIKRNFSTGIDAAHGRPRGFFIPFEACCAKKWRGEGIAAFINSAINL